MKTSLLSISTIVLMGVLLFTSCKKEEPPVPEPDPEEECDTCITFDGAGIYEEVGIGEITFGDVFYFENGISFRAKYGGIGAASAVQTVPHTDPWPENFSGDKLLTGTNIVQLDFTEKGYECTHIEFDMNITSDYGPGVFNINAEEVYLPDGVAYFTQPDFSAHVVMEGAITTIELPAGNEYDNICVTACDTTYPPPPPTEICIDFNSFMLDDVVELTDVDYGDPVLTTMGVSFSVKYEDLVDFDDILDYGIRDLTAAGYSDENLNFEDRGWVFGEVKCLVDFSALAFSNKKVSFDISNGVFTPTDVNEFSVNGFDVGTLPAGITYNFVDLGLAGNGMTCYRVEITGDINTIEWRGFEIAYDNLCIEEIE